MFKGLGLDLCETGRMEKLLKDDRFLNRFFTEEEKNYVRGKGKRQAESLAGIFAAKEALGKALGTGLSFEMKEAEVLHDALGCPFYHLTGTLAEQTQGDSFLLSISHDGGIAGAVCLRQAANYEEIGKERK